MDIGKQSSCLTVTTGEWVCRRRKALGTASSTYQQRMKDQHGYEGIATPAGAAKGAHYDEKDG